MLEVLIAVVPLLFLLGLLLFGIYPGCDAVIRLAERLSPTWVARRSPRRARRPRGPRSFAPGGGLLIGFGHAQRPPPLAP
jgi:hypothetical protein